MRLNIEMQDPQEADMVNIPPSKLPSWLQNKLDEEKKKLEKEDESSVDQMPIDSHMSGSPDAMTDGGKDQLSPANKTGMRTFSGDKSPDAM